MAGKKRAENAVKRDANISVMLTEDEKAEFRAARLTASAALGVDLGDAGMGRVSMRWFQAAVNAGLINEIAQYLDEETVLAPSVKAKLGL